MRSQHGDTLDKQLHALSTLRHIGEAISRALKTQRRVREAITCAHNTATHWKSNHMHCQHCDTLEKQLHALSKHCDTTLRHTLRQSCETKSNMLRELHFHPKAPSLSIPQDTHEMLYNTSDSQNKIRRQGIQSPAHPQFESPSHIQIVEQEVHRGAEEFVPHPCGFQPRNSLAVPDRSMQTNNANHDNHIPKGNLTLKEAHCLSNGCCN